MKTRAEQPGVERALSPAQTAPAPWEDAAASPQRRRGGWTGITLICTGLVALAVLWALVLNSFRPETYGARVDVVYLPDSGVSLDVRERVLGTQAAILQSRAVLAPVAAQTRVSLADLQDAVSVKLGLSDVLEITVAHQDPQTARRLAQAVADRYVQFTAGLPNAPVVRVLTGAYSLHDPLSPRPTRAVAVGLLVGLHLAMAVAWWLYRRQRRNDPG